MGKRKGGACDQGPKAMAFWIPGSRWHWLLLWPRKEEVHLFYSFSDVRITPANEKKALSFYLQVVYYSVRNMCKYFVQSPVWNKQPYVATNRFCHSFLVGVALALDIWPWCSLPSTPDLEMCCICGLLVGLDLPGELGQYLQSCFSRGKNPRCLGPLFPWPRGETWGGWRLSRHHSAPRLCPTTVGQLPMLSFDLTCGGHRAGQDTAPPLGPHQRTALKEQFVFSGSFIVDWM